MDFSGILKLVNERNILIVSKLQKDVLLSYATNNRMFFLSKLMTYEDFFNDYFRESKEEIMIYIFEIFKMKEVDIKYINKIYELLFYDNSELELDLFKLVDQVRQKLHVNDLRIYKNRKVFTDNKCISNLLDATYYKLTYKKTPINVLQFTNVIDEINAVAQEISVLVNSSVSFNNIYIYTQYDKALMSVIFRTYNIVLEGSIAKNPLVDLKYDIFVKDIEACLNLEELIKTINEYQNLDSNYLSAISKFLVINCDFKSKLKFIVQKLKTVKSNSCSFSNKVKIVNENACFSDDDYIFVVGYNSHLMPQKAKDDFLFSQKVAKSMDYEYIGDINSKYQKMLLNLVSHKNKFITAQNKQEIPDLTDGNIKQGDFKFGSKSMNMIKYTKLDQDFKKFNITSEIHSKLRNHYKISDYVRPKYKLNNPTIRNIDISATTIEYYYQCPFKFYLSKVLKIRPDTSNVKMIIGNLIHKGLEVGVISGVNAAIIAVDEEFEIQNIEHDSAIWQYYKREVTNNLVDVLQELETQKLQSNFNVSTVEEGFDILIDESYNIHLKGKIDKVISYDNYIAVVDYKSNVKKVDLNLLDFGIGIQNFIYLFVLKNNFSDKIVAGTYRQSVIKKIIRLSEEKRFDYYLEGYTRSDEFSINNLDTKTQESFIKGIKTNKDGSLRKSTMLLPGDNLELLVEKVKNKIDLMVENMVSGDFVATEKVIMSNKKLQNISCNYCAYLDICQKTKNERVYLEVEHEVN